MLAHQHLQVQQVQPEDAENDKTRRYAELVEGISVRPGFTIPLGVLERTRAEKIRAQQMKTTRSFASCGFVDGMISPPSSLQKVPAEIVEVTEDDEEMQEFYAEMAEKATNIENAEMAEKENKIETVEMLENENNIENLNVEVAKKENTIETAQMEEKENGNETAPTAEKKNNDENEIEKKEEEIEIAEKENGNETAETAEKKNNDENEIEKKEEEIEIAEKVDKKNNRKKDEQIEKAKGLNDKNGKKEKKKEKVVPSRKQKGAVKEPKNSKAMKVVKTGKTLKQPKKTTKTGPKKGHHKEKRAKDSDGKQREDEIRKKLHSAFWLTYYDVYDSNMSQKVVKQLFFLEVQSLSSGLFIRLACGQKERATIGGSDQAS